MAIRVFDRYGARSIAPTTEYPLGSCKNSTTPGAKDGTPGDKNWMDDIWGVLQRLLSQSNIAADGNPDNVLVSQYMQALQRIFPPWLTYNDVGTTDNYLLNPISGSTVDDYFDGMVVIFRPGNSNTGPAVVRIDGLADKSIVYETGLPLASGALLTTKHAILIYEQLNNRFVLVGVEPAESVVFDKYISGLLIYNGAVDQDNDIRFFPGAAKAINDPAVLMILSSTITKRKDELWAEGDNQGGTLDSLLPTASTTVHCFILRRSIDGYIDAGFSTNLDISSKLPSGYGQYRRVGSVRLDSSANIQDFTPQELGGGMMAVGYDERIYAGEISSPTVSFATSVPQDISPIVKATFTGESTNLTYVLIDDSLKSPTGSTPGANNHTFYCESSSTTSNVTLDLYVGGTPFVKVYITGSLTGGSSVMVLGFTDRRLN